MKNSDICMWCGETYKNHDFARSASSPVPRVPCLMLKDKFVLRKEKDNLIPDGWEIVVTHKVGRSIETSKKIISEKEYKMASFEIVKFMFERILEDLGYYNDQ